MPFAKLLALPPSPCTYFLWGPCALEMSPIASSQGLIVWASPDDPCLEEGEDDGQGEGWSLLERYDRELAVYEHP